MRLLLLIAVIAFVIAFVCSQVPTAALGVAWAGWLAIGLIAWALDALLGGWTAPVGLPRRVP